eukprot:PRCOL_00006848-RA
MLSAVATALAAFVVAGAMARTADGIDSGSGAGDQPVGGRLDAAAVTGGRGESSDNLWEKLMASWLWMARAHASGHRMLRGARWVLKLDIDGIFLPANFERLTREQGWDANATTHPWYLGHTNTWRLKGGTGPPFNTGQYALSVGAMRAVAPRLREAIAATDDQSVLDDPAFLAYKQSAGVPRMGTEDYCANAWGTHADDLNIAVCLALVGVKATPAVDAMGREYFLPFDPRAHRWLEYAERDTAKPWRTWFWDGKTREQSLENCCAPRIAAIHGFARERTLLEWGWVIDERAVVGAGAQPIRMSRLPDST